MNNRRPSQSSTPARATTPVPRQPRVGTDPESHPKQLAMELSAAAHRFALEASGLTEPQLAARICSNRGYVKHFGSEERSDAPTLLHLVLAPDTYTDPLLCRLAVERAELGHALREWAAAVPVSEDIDLGELHHEGLASSLNLARALLASPLDEATERQLELFGRESLRAETAARAIRVVTGRKLRAIRGGR